MHEELFDPTLAHHSSMAKELRLRGPATRSQLLRYFEDKHIDAAVRKRVLYIYSIARSRVKLYDLGSAGAKLVGVKFHEKRSTAGLFNALSMRYAIEWYEERGWTCVRRNPSNPHVAYMAEQAYPGDPQGDREAIIVKHCDYTHPGAENLIAREAQYAKTNGNYQLTFLVRNALFAAELEVRSGINAKTRDFLEMIASAPDDIRPLLTDYHV